MYLGKRGIEIADMLNDMQNHNQIKRRVVEFHGLNIALVHAQTKAASVGQRCVRIIQATRHEARILLDGSQQVPLPAADLKHTNCLAGGKKTADPERKQPILEASSHAAGWLVLSAWPGETGLVVTAQKVGAGMVAGEDKSTLQTLDHVVIILAMPELLLRAVTKGTLGQDCMLC